MHEEQSLARQLAHDLDAHFERLVRTYQDRLYGFALRLLRDPQEAEECAQDTFVRAYRALARYPAERVEALRLRAWLYQIALNVVRNRVRKPSLAAVPVGAAATEGVAASTAEQPEAVALHEESWTEIASALARLPERYRTAVVLRHVQGLSYAEAADVLEQPIGTTKSDVHRGLLLLRRALVHEGRNH